MQFNIANGNKNQNTFIFSLFYFLLPLSRESAITGSNFRNGDFDGFTRFEVL